MDLFNKKKVEKLELENEYLKHRLSVLEKVTNRRTPKIEDIHSCKEMFVLDNPVKRYILKRGDLYALSMYMDTIHPPDAFLEHTQDNKWVKEEVLLEYVNKSNYFVSTLEPVN